MSSVNLDKSSKYDKKTPGRDKAVFNFSMTPMGKSGKSESQIGMKVYENKLED